MFRSSLHRFLHDNSHAILLVLFAILLGFADLLVPFLRRVMKRHNGTSL